MIIHIDNQRNFQWWVKENELPLIVAMLDKLSTRCTVDLELHPWMTPMTTQTLIIRDLKKVKKKSMAMKKTFDKDYGKESEGNNNFKF